MSGKVRHGLVIGMLGGLALAMGGSLVRADDITTKWTPAGGGGTLEVKVTGSPGVQQFDKLQIQCKQGDVGGNFTIGGADGAAWSAQAAPDFLVTKGSGASTTYHCVFKRSSATTSNQTVTFTTATKRGGGGAISIGLGADPKSGINESGNAVLVAVGTCDLPGTTACMCDATDYNCALEGGTFLGDAPCPGGGVCVPAVSEWGALALLLTVLTAGTMVVRGRSAASAV